MDENKPCRIGEIVSGEKIIACVSPAPSSARVIHEAARTARETGTRWIALYVDTEKAKLLKSTEYDQDNIEEHFSLIKRLGGRIERITGKNVVEEIARYTENNNIKLVIIGKDTSKATGFFFKYKDKVLRLIRMRPDLEIHVVPENPRLTHVPNKKRVCHLHDKPVKLSAIFLSILIFLTATLSGLFFSSWGIGEANIIMLFLLAVLMVSIIGGRLPGMIASITAVLLFNFFFTKPIGTLLINDFQYLITFPVMFAVALITSELTTRLHRQVFLSLKRERRTEVLYRTSRSLLRASGIKAVAYAALEHLLGLLQRDVFCYIPGSDEHPDIFRLNLTNSGRTGNHDSFDILVAEWSIQNSKPAGRGTDVMAKSDTYCYPLVIQGRVLGVVGIVCTDISLEESAYNLVEAVAAQLSLALDRERLSKIEEENRVEIERERLRNTLLRSISHDLRTPLTTIAGAASTLLTLDSVDEKEMFRDFANEIFEDASWLTHLVENLLSLTRVEGEMLEFSRDIEVAEDLMASAMERFRGRTKDHIIKTFLPETPALIKIDASLIEQVLINLINNSIQHTPSGSIIEIRISYTEKVVIFEVCDNGPGFSQKALDHAFERFFTENPGRIERRGLGLGLAICKAIVEAHDGDIYLHNRETRGAIVRFTLPRVNSLPSPLDEKGGNYEYPSPDSDR